MAMERKMSYVAVLHDYVEEQRRLKDKPRKSEDRVATLTVASWCLSHSPSVKGGDFADRVDQRMRGLFVNEAVMLPELVMIQVMEYLGHLSVEDLVSAGQVCQYWRQVAKLERLWRWRKIKSHEMNIADFVRIMLFAPCLHTLDVCWINQVFPQDREIRKQAIINSQCRVSTLTGVMCHRDCTWAQDLLRIQAPHLQELVISTADRAALATIERMPLLRRLDLSSWDADLLKAPFLFQDPPPPPVRVADDEEEEEYDDEAPRGLVTLVVRGLPQLTTLSMLRANRHTLSEITLNVGTPCFSGPDEWPRTCNDLADLLAQCELLSLTRLTLTRYVCCEHFGLACMNQISALWKALPGVFVICKECMD